MVIFINRNSWKHVIWSTYFVVRLTAPSRNLAEHNHISLICGCFMLNSMDFYRLKSVLKQTQTKNMFQQPKIKTMNLLECILRGDNIISTIYLFGVLRRFQHCTGHITTGSWEGRGNQYIEFVRVLYCKLPTNSKQLPAFALEAVLGIESQPQRWEARVLPLCHRGPYNFY